MNIDRETASSIVHGHATVGTSRAKLYTGTIRPAIKGVLLRCPGADDPAPNTAPVWIGNENVTANSNATSGGLPIAPGEAVFVPIDDVTKLYVVSTAASQDVAWMLA